MQPTAQAVGETAGGTSSLGRKKIRWRGTAQVLRRKTAPQEEKPRGAPMSKQRPLPMQKRKPHFSLSAREMGHPAAIEGFRLND